MIKCHLEPLGTMVDAKTTLESITQLLGNPSEFWDDGVEDRLEYHREAFVFRFLWDVASFLERRTFQTLSYGFQSIHGFALLCLKHWRTLVFISG
jgi:hypothetical protein